MLFWPSAIHKAAFLQEFSFPFDFVDPVSMDFRFSAVTLNDHPRHFVVPRLLNLHPSHGKPEDGSDGGPEGGAAGWGCWLAMVHVELLPSGATSLFS